VAGRGGEVVHSPLAGGASAHPSPGAPQPKEEDLHGGSHYPTALLYDWDNTLVDGWAGIAAALNAVFTSFAMPVWTAAETKARARTALREAFPTMFGARWEEARDIFYTALTATHLNHVRPMPGAKEALQAGHPRPQGIVSNKTGSFLRAEVAHLGWTPHFRAVIGAGDAAADKPNPAPIYLALRTLGELPARSVWYVGDTALDMRAAHAAGVTAVLLGDASHDGGVDHASPDLHFPTAHALAAHLRLLATG
jgi:phosphoglycolate phosphatase